MSDQTPPSGEPVPVPAEDSGDVTAEETTPPAEAEVDGADEATPPPPTETEGATPPPAPEKKSRKMFVPIVAAAIVLAMAAVAVGVVMFVTGSDSHKIVTPSTAGDMKRATSKETELKPQLDSAEQQFKTQAKNVSYVKSAVYTQADSKRGPKGDLVFLGAKLSKPQVPAKFVSSFEKQATANGFKVTKVSAGDGGGKAVCAAQTAGTQKIAICAWATEDSMGELVPTVPGWDTAKLAKMLLILRPDVEQSE